MHVPACTALHSMTICSLTLIFSLDTPLQVGGGNILDLDSRVGEYSQLSGKQPFVHVGGAQPWPHHFPPPGAGLSRHALADGRPACKFELDWCGRANSNLWQFGQRKPY